MARYNVHRRDSNHAAIIKALRSIGASVQDLSQVGGGCPDIIVGWQGRDYWMELKDGDRPPSERKLSPAEADWHLKWRGSKVYTVNSVEEAFAVIQPWKL